MACPWNFWRFAKFAIFSTDLPLLSAKSHLSKKWGGLEKPKNGRFLLFFSIFQNLIENLDGKSRLWHLLNFSIVLSSNFKVSYHNFFMHALRTRLSRIVSMPEFFFIFWKIFKGRYHRPSSKIQKKKRFFALRFRLSTHLYRAYGDTFWIATIQKKIRHFFYKSLDAGFCELFFSRSIS